MFHTIAASTMLFASLTAPAQVASAMPDDITINVVNANGSGCPGGTAKVDVSDDNKAFTVTYSNYIALVGVGASATDFRKNCQLGLDVNLPSGYTFAIAEANYRGFLKLAKNSSATETANYYFQGQSQTTRIKHSFKGEKSSSWQTTDKVGITSLNFLPCGEQRNLNINTELLVDAGKSDVKKKTSLIGMDSSDGSVSTIYHLAYKTCP